MKRAILLIGIIVILFALGEVGIRIVEGGALPLWKLTTLLLSLSVLAGGILFLLSYYFESRWRGFAALIWVCENIIPLGGRKNALILGIAGIVSGVWALFKLAEG
ncbi:MAG: hypothetical protein HY760_02580 [Nitrospirae bacterium]|nr:hypothetical protein [Nitrospirota bacterium]